MSAQHRGLMPPDPPKPLDRNERTLPQLSLDRLPVSSSTPALSAFSSAPHPNSLISPESSLPRNTPRAPFDNNPSLVQSAGLIQPTGVTSVSAGYQSQDRQVPMSKLLVEDPTARSANASHIGQESLQTQRPEASWQKKALIPEKLPASGQALPSGQSGARWDEQEIAQADIIARIEQDRRRQEEERTKQEELRLEQRKIEQNIFSEALRNSVPAPMVPLIFAGLGSGVASNHLAQVNVELAQYFMNQTQQQQQQQQQQKQQLQQLQQQNLEKQFLQQQMEMSLQRQSIPPPSQPLLVAQTESRGTTGPNPNPYGSQQLPLTIPQQAQKGLLGDIQSVPTIDYPTSISRFNPHENQFNAPLLASSGLLAQIGQKVPPTFVHNPFSASPSASDHTTSTSSPALHFHHYVPPRQLNNSSSKEKVGLDGTESVSSPSSSRPTTSKDRDRIASNHTSQPNLGAPSRNSTTPQDRHRSTVSTSGESTISSTQIPTSSIQIEAQNPAASQTSSQKRKYPEEHKAVPAPPSPPYSTTSSFSSRDPSSKRRHES